MFGWVADFFRFVWGLLYWNTRKSWFQLRRGRAACPCQSPSDSGRALETGCDACMSWDRPDRFARVCPLLVRTPAGLRCAADTADVRPFWGLAARYYGGAALALYTAAVLSVFVFLRTVGYPVSIVQVALPPMWHRVGQARGWYFLHRSQQAFATGRTNEGLLYLANAYQFDPSNYEAGLMLAKSTQAGQPGRSDDIFARLLREHPQHRDVTAQHWFRALLARGDFGRMATLAESEVTLDRAHASVWMRGLIFATRQLKDPTPLQHLQRLPGAAPWRDVLRTELLLQQGSVAAAHATLSHDWPAAAPAGALVYRIETLLALGQPAEAVDLLLQHRTELDPEAYVTLRLHCLASAGALNETRREVESLVLSQPLTQAALKLVCAQLIRHPDTALSSELFAKVSRETPPLTDDTAGGWFSLLCTAGAVGDQAELHALTLHLRRASQTPFSALQMTEAFFRGEIGDGRATSFLPFLPLPLEVTYALLERYPAGSNVTVRVGSA